MIVLCLEGTFSCVRTYTDLFQVRQVIRTVKRRLPPGYYDLEDEFNNDSLEDEDGNPKYKIGYVPPKTTNMNKQVRRRILTKIDLTL